LVTSEMPMGTEIPCHTSMFCLNSSDLNQTISQSFSERNKTIACLQSMLRKYYGTTFSHLKVHKNSSQSRKKI
jgi:hypothetical protein